MIPDKIDLIANLSRIHSYYPRKEIKLIYTEIIGARGITENHLKEKNRFADGGIFQWTVNWKLTSDNWLLIRHLGGDYSEIDRPFTPSDS